MAAVSNWVAPDSTPGPAPPTAPLAAFGARNKVGSASAALAPVRLHPRTAVQLLDAACRVLHRRGRTLVPAVLALALPVQVGVTVLQRRVGLDTRAVMGSSLLDVGAAVDGGQAAVSYLALALDSLLLAVLGAVIAPVVVADVFGQPTTTGAALRAGLRRLPAIAAAWFLAKIALVVGGCFVFGGVAIAVWTLCVSPVIAIEGLGPIAGLKRSFSLANRRWFSCLGVVLLTALVSTVVSLALSALPLLVGLAGPLERADWVLRALAGLLSTVIVVPIVCGTAALAYLDLRVRTEGLDLQVELNRG